MKYFIIKTSDDNGCSCSSCYSESIKAVLRGPNKYKLSVLATEFVNWCKDIKGVEQKKFGKKRHSCWFADWLVEYKGFKPVINWEECLL